MTGSFRPHHNQHRLVSLSLALTRILTIAIIYLCLSDENCGPVSSLVIDKQIASVDQSVSSLENRQQPVINENAYKNNNINNNQVSELNYKKDANKQVFEGTQSTGVAQSHPHRIDYKRPIWNIAHMVNSIKELDYRLSKGANAVEADVTFNALGQPTFIYHGPPCDCWRHCHQQEDFDDYLAYVHEIALAEPTGIGRNLSLLFLDLKLDHLDAQAKERAGRELAASVMTNLYPRHTQYLATLDSQARRKLRLILSINHVTDVGLVNNFIHHLETRNASDLLQRIGFDVGMNDDIQQIESMWRRFGNNLQVPLNLWQGDGFTNCISPFYNLERLSKAISKRDNELGYPKKVYQWTIDLHDRMREAFVLGVDAIMTNHPERVLAVLSEPDIGHNFRLATRDDDPFRKIPAKSIYRNNGGARYPRTISPVSGGFFGSLMDVFNSWLIYMKEIPYLSLPSRFMSKVQRQFKFRSAPDSQMSASDSKSGFFLPSTLFPNVNYTTIGTSQTISRSFEGQYQNLSITKRSTAATDKTSSTPSISSNSSTTQEPVITSRAANIQEDKITTISSNDTQIQAKETSNQEKSTTTTIEPPKWYTAMASNFLVSMLKLALPVNSTTMTTTTSTTTTTESPKTTTE